MSTSLRSRILQHALPLLPRHSFTRQTLSIALSTLRPDLATGITLPTDGSDGPSSTSSSGARQSDALDDGSRIERLGVENVIDTIFGTGPTAPAKGLLAAWEEQGLEIIESSADQIGLRDRLEARLDYSSRVGQHLVEAYALMSSPGSTPSLPLPTIPPSILASLPSFRLPPLYAPPGSSPSPFSSTGPSPVSSRGDGVSLFEQIEHLTGGRLPFLRFNPLGPLGYAWNVADSALRVDERKQGVKKGLVNEPTGSGPEWYTSRISLGLAYLAAESHLLQPTPNLEDAKLALRRHLQSYESLRDGVKISERGAGDMMGMLEFMGRGAVGLLRSRGL